MNQMQTHSPSVQLDRPLSVREVAPLLGLTYLTLRQNIYRRPNKIPRFTRTQTGRVIFWPFDIKSWQDGIRQPAPRPVGRPTKAEAIAKAKAATEREGGEND